MLLRNSNPIIHDFPPITLCSPSYTRMLMYLPKGRICSIHKIIDSTDIDNHVQVKIKFHLPTNFSKIIYDLMDIRVIKVHPTC